MASISAALIACSGADSPDTQVRKSIAAIEEAAEQRDVGAVTKHLSEQVHDAYGRNPRELAQYLRGYFIANQSIHLLTRINSLDFPTQEEARAQVTVAMVGREADESNAWNVAGDIHDFDVTFRRENDAWKVIYFDLKH